MCSKHSVLAGSIMNDRTAGYQRRAGLTFLHWRVPADVLQKQLPQGLTLDTWQGNAWLGVVPFSMERVRPWWSPPVPGISWFLETNVRTYVRGPAGEPGVWFFSLDANQRLAVEIARRVWNLPYRWARLSYSNRETRENSQRILIANYSGTRRESPAASYQIEIAADLNEPRPADPDTLEYFLVERYLLFCEDSRGGLYSGRVHHEPYRVCPVIRQQIRQTLTTPVLDGSSLPEHAEHALWSPAVDVRISPLQPYRAR